MSSTKKVKVLAYVTRNTPNGHELLVFDHHNMPEAGTQVVAGSVDSHESLRAAVRRELKEESGLSDVQAITRLMTVGYFHIEKQQDQIRNFFHVIPKGNLPSSWSHKVSAGDEDKGMVFDFYWLPLDKAQDQLTGLQGQAITKLHTILSQPN